MKKILKNATAAVLLLVSAGVGAQTTRTAMPASAPVAEYQGTKFTPGNVRPYLNDLQHMLKDLQAVQTPAQAEQYQNALTREATALGGRAVTYKQALDHAAYLTVRGGATQDARDAESLTQQVGQLGPQVHAQMIRVGKLNAQLKLAFKQYRALQK